MNYVAVLVVAAVVGGVLGGEAPYLEMYTGSDSSGAMLKVTSAIEDLKDVGFGDVTRSVCGVGLWFMYEDAHYGKGSKWEQTFASPTRICMNLDSSRRDKVSSVRYAGLDDIDFPTLTMYEHNELEGSELLVVRDLDILPGGFNDKASSFAITGSSAWTIYHDDTYGGGSTCLQPAEDNGWYYGTWFEDDVDMNNDEVSSVKKGCHSDRVLKYQIPEH